MSATRDPSQKHTFVYSNLYQLYRKGKEAANSAVVPPPAPAAKTEAPREEDARSTRGLAAGRVIKVDDMNSETGAVGIRVTRHEPPRLLAKHIEANRMVPTPKADLVRRQALDGLRDNLRQLQTLHERLRFMLKEIEELSKE
jgi:hypothetical protein